MNEVDGVIENGMVVVEYGKIKIIYKGLVFYGIFNGVKVIDGLGKILMLGIIDEYLYIVLMCGVNESGQFNIFEVCMGDVLFFDDINIYC